MARVTKRLMPANTGSTPVAKIEMDNFARRLHAAMARKGMSQSDLAREMWGVYVDKRGYEVARNRDRISVYLRGAGYPEQANLEKMAEILGIDAKELAPDLTAAAVDRDNPELALTAVAGHHDSVYLRVNKLVSLELAAKIATMISEYEKTKSK